MSKEIVMGMFGIRPDATTLGMIKMGEKAKKDLTPPDVPSRRNRRVQAAAARALLEASQRTGRSSTILTGPQGLTGDPLIGRKTLLGE